MSPAEILRILQELERETRALNESEQIARARRAWREFVQAQYRNLIDAKSINDDNSVDRSPGD